MTKDIVIGAVVVLVIVVLAWPGRKRADGS